MIDRVDVEVRITVSSKHATRSCLLQRQAVKCLQTSSNVFCPPNSPEPTTSPTMEIFSVNQ